MPEGLSIAEMMKVSCIDPVLMRNAEVWLEDPASGRSVLVPPENWHRVRPKPAADLVIRAYGGKGGGGSKSMLSIALTIAVMAASSFATFGLSGAGVFGGIAGGAVGIPSSYYKGRATR
jgi:hypothetical protein